MKSRAYENSSEKPLCELLTKIQGVTANLPSRDSLRRLETQGLIVMLRTPGGKTESVYLTAAGRQKALKLTGSYE